MRYLTLLLTLAAAGCGSQPHSGVKSHDTAETAGPSSANVRGPTSELAARADSLGRLDPGVEARAAIARGDLRFLAVCGFACVPVGIPMDSAAKTSDSLAVRGDSVRRIPGTSDAIVNEDVDRLNRVASAYATRYNRVIWAHRRELRRR